MRDFACILSLARGFSRPAGDGAEPPASVDSEAPQSPCGGEPALHAPDALRLAPARSPVPAAKSGH
jgi:hypothetical protein